MVGAELARKTGVLVAVVPLSCTWQFTFVLLVALDGEQEIPVSVGSGATSVIDAVFVDPFRLALTVAVPPLVIVPAVAEKLALVAPAAAVTDAGAVRFAWFDDTASTKPPAGAAPLNVAVQFATPPEFNDVGVHVSPVTVTGGASSVMTAVLVDPLSETLTVAEPSVVIVPAVAEKLALVAPAAAVTDAGAVRFAWFDDTASTKPPAGAAPLNVAVQFATPPEFNDVGVHVSPVTVTGGGGARTVTVPLAPVSGTVVADGVAPTTPTTSIVTVAVAVTSIMATTPFGIVVWLKPVSKHIYVPVPALQLMFFPAPLAAAPIFAFIAEIAAAGNCRVHCKADGAVPVGDVSVRFKLTGLPALVLADDNASVPDCPNTGDSARPKRTKYRIDI